MRGRGAVGSAFDWQSKGHGFESRRLHHKFSVRIPYGSATVWEGGMMKKIVCAMLCILVLIFLIGCAPGKVEKIPEKEEPSRLEIQKSIGCEYLKNKQWDDAINCFKRAIKLEPKDFDSYAGLANGYMGKGLPDSALLVYTDFVRKIDPDSPEGHYGIGYVLVSMYNYDEAIKEYNIALAKKSDYVEALQGKGVAFNKKLEPDSAILYLEKAKELKPEELSIRYALGEAYINGKRYTDAIKELTEVVTKYPNDIQAHTSLGDAYFEAKKYESAVEEYKKVLELWPAYYTVVMKLGKTYEEMKCYTEALKSYFKAKEISSREPTAYYNIAGIYIKLKKYREAESITKKSLELDTLNVLPYVLLGDIYRDMGDKNRKLKKWTSALREYGKAIKEYAKGILDPNYGDYAKRNIKNCGKKIKITIELRKTEFGYD